MLRQACTTLLLTFLASAAQAAPTYDHLYAFGDSYSDNGAGEAFTRTLVSQNIKEAQVLPGERYWQGRWSNGPTAVEGLAQALKVPLTDYAIGGAKSGHGNYYTWMLPTRDTGLLGQVDAYLKATPDNKANPESLYFLFVSANDFFEWADFSHTQSIEQLSSTATRHIRQAVDTLASAGAQQFMVVGTTDLSRVPAVVQGKQVEQATRFQQALERDVPAMLETLAKTQDVKIVYFDHLAFSTAVRATPQASGFRDLDTPCQATYPQVKPVCSDPDTHYYWDEWHPTRKVHALAADAMFKALQARQ